MFSAARRVTARPSNLFDLPAYAVITLDGVGAAALALADTIERTRCRATAPRLERPRSRLGPQPASHSDFGVPDSVRIR